MASIRIAVAALIAFTGSAMAAEPPAQSPLLGTWTLVAADKILRTGQRLADYGDSPKGRLMVDASGRYSLQIFKSERPRFVAPDKADGSAEEFKAAVMGSSTHFGTVSVNAGEGTLAFEIESASFPNWEGTRQIRQFTLKDGLLTYRVPPRADGSTPVSVWRKQE